jgi:hypothetical protein
VQTVQIDQVVRRTCDGSPWRCPSENLGMAKLRAIYAGTPEICRKAVGCSCSFVGSVRREWPAGTSLQPACAEAKNVSETSYPLMRTIAKLVSYLGEVRQRDECAAH